MILFCFLDNDGFTQNSDWKLKYFHHPFVSSKIFVEDTLFRHKSSLDFNAHHKLLCQYDIDDKFGVLAGFGHSQRGYTRANKRTYFYNPIFIGSPDTVTFDLERVKIKTHYINFDVAGICYPVNTNKVFISLGFSFLTDVLISANGEFEYYETSNFNDLNELEKRYVDNFNPVTFSYSFDLELGFKTKDIINGGIGFFIENSLSDIDSVNMEKGSRGIGFALIFTYFLKSANDKKSANNNHSEQ